MAAAATTVSVGAAGLGTPRLHEASGQGGGLNGTSTRDHVTAVVTELLTRGSAPERSECGMRPPTMMATKNPKRLHRHLCDMTTRLRANCRRAAPVRAD